MGNICLLPVVACAIVSADCVLVCSVMQSVNEALSQDKRLKTTEPPNPLLCRVLGGSLPDCTVAVILSVARAVAEMAPFLCLWSAVAS